MEIVAPPAFTHGRYACALADPPWHFKTYTGAGTPHRTENDHYRVTPTAELADIPVADWMLPDSSLFMWAVDSHIPQAIRLGENWGFTYKTVAFVWAKTNKSKPGHRIGMGYWTRKQTEQCLLFTRGHPRRLSASVRQLIEAPIREHSRKPDAQYERIEALVGGPRLEMFARRSFPGWDAWGNEPTKFDADNWEIEKTPPPALPFLERDLPADHLDHQFKTDRAHGDPTL